MAARKTTTTTEDPPRRRGRPARFAKGDLRNTTFWLQPANLEWLDDAVVAARGRMRGQAVAQEFNRSAILRGLLKAVSDGGLDLSACDTEAAVRAAVLGWARRKG